MWQEQLDGIMNKNKNEQDNNSIYYVFCSCYNK